MQLYLDCDGVLADFDRGATELLGMAPRQFEKRKGMGAFWAALARHGDFYASLPLMPDARRLFDAVRHLEPIILTGLPRGNWAAPQKVRWAAKHFPGTRILTVMAVDKRNHCRAGDILIDSSSNTPIYGKARAAPSSITAMRRARSSNSPSLACQFVKRQVPKSCGLYPSTARPNVRSERPSPAAG